jgi:hypothetical protein
VSFRSFLYQDFDRAPDGSIGSGADSGTDALPEDDARPYREIDIVRREGFEAGRVRGLAEGRQASLEEAEIQLAHDLPELLVNLGGAAAEMARAKLACERDALLLAGAALRQMLPIVAERGLEREAAALVAEVIANAPAPGIEVRAAPRTREAIERRCDALPSGITLVTAPEMPEGGVRCVWANGQARFDGAAVTEAVLAIIDRCLDGMDEAPAHLPALEQAPSYKEN